MGYLPLRGSWSYYCGTIYIVWASIHLKINERWYAELAYKNAERNGTNKCAALEKYKIQEKYTIITNCVSSQYQHIPIRRSSYYWCS